MNELQRFAPPLTLWNAGHQRVASREYVHHVRKDERGPRRVLIKHSTSGEGVIYVHEQRYRVPQGHVFMIERPGPYRYAYEGDGTPWEFSYVCFHVESQRSLLPYQLRMSPVIDIRSRPRMAADIHALVEHFAKARETGLRESLMAYELYVSCVEASRGATSAENKMERLKQQLQAHFTQDISLAACAEDIGMTHAAMSRSFKQAYGMTPGNFIMQLRLRRACRLLNEQELPVKDIANACGFQSANYFARAFKAQLGQSPVAYRRNPNVLGTA